jgi:hypothetical protein
LLPTGFHRRQTGFSGQAAWAEAASDVLRQGSHLLAYDSRGETEEERVPDFRRCERIRWPKPIIEHAGDPAIRVWRNERRGGERVCLWFVQESYLVVLAERGEYVLFLTAYLVEQQHRQRKLQKECEEYWKKQKS